jgi:hypothetical protein
VPENERKFSGVYRELIEDVSVIAAICLTRRRGRVVGIESAGALNHRAPYRKAALLLNHERRGLSGILSHGACSSHQSG